MSPEQRPPAAGVEFEINECDIRWRPRGWAHGAILRLARMAATMMSVEHAL